MGSQMGENKFLIKFIIYLKSYDRILVSYVFAHCVDCRFIGFCNRDLEVTAAVIPAYLIEFDVRLPDSSTTPF